MGLQGKVAHDMMLSTGFMTYFTIADMANITKSGIDAMGTAMSGAHNKDEGYGREMGEAMGGVIGSVAMAAVNIDILRHQSHIYGNNKTWWKNSAKGPQVMEGRIMKSGGVYRELQAGGFQRAGRMVKGTFTPLEGESIIAEGSMRAKAIQKAGKAGFLIGEEGAAASKFVKGMSFARGMGMMGAMIGVGMIARGVLGFAGGLVDEATRDMHREKAVHYDNRFFNTQQQEQSNLQTLGMAMNNYENRFQSTARIYHSR